MRLSMTIMYAAGCLSASVEADTVPLSMMNLASYGTGQGEGQVYQGVRPPANVAGRFFYDPNGAAVEKFDVGQWAGAFKRVGTDGNFAAFWTFSMTQVTRDMQTMMASNQQWDWTWSDLEVRGRASNERYTMASFDLTDRQVGVMEETNGLWTTSDGLSVFRYLDPTTGTGLIGLVGDSLPNQQFFGENEVDRWIGIGSDGELNIGPASTVPLPSVVLLTAGVLPLVCHRRRLR